MYVIGMVIYSNCDFLTQKLGTVVIGLSNSDWHFYVVTRN